MTEYESTVFLEPLATALKLELEGRAFFREAAAKFESELARQTFEFLAAEEDRHIEKIQDLYQSIKDTGNTDLPDLEGTPASERFDAFTERVAGLRDEISPTATDTEAYEYGLKFENGAEEFYAECRDNATDPNIREFYDWLIREEEMHSKLLQSCLDFARDPAKWFENRPKGDATE